MTLSSLSPRKAGLGMVALAYTALTFGAVAAPHSAEARGSVFYTAELAAPAADRVNVIGGLAWMCDGTACSAAKGHSRPVIECQRVVRALGAVTAFTAGGEALDDEALARCNGN